MRPSAVRILPSAFSRVKSVSASGRHIHSLSVCSALHPDTLRMPSRAKWKEGAMPSGTVKNQQFVPANRRRVMGWAVANLRRTPPMTGAQLRQHLERFTAAFNARSGSALEPSGYYDEEPLIFDPNAKLVKRLTAAYERATGSPGKPVIAGGGTYAARVPNSIAFGMWFPGTPYPGHDVDERNSLRDLHQGVNVLVEVLADLAGSQPLLKPLQR
jgi:hypothetical protein